MQRKIIEQRLGSNLLKLLEQQQMAVEMLMVGSYVLYIQSLPQNNEIYVLLL